MKGNRRLIIENMMQGSARQLFSDIRKSVSDFGNVLKSSIGLVVSDASYLASHTFHYTLLRSDQIRERRSKHRSVRENHLRNINSALQTIESNQTLDGVVVSMMIAPGFAITERVLRPINLENESTARFVKDIGLTEVPIIGSVTEWLMSDESVFDGTDNWQKDFQTWAKGENKPTESVSSTAWKWTQSVFLLNFRGSTVENSWYSGPLLRERSDDTEDIELPDAPKSISDLKVPSNITSQEQFEDWLLSEVVSMEIKVDTSKALKIEEEYLEETLAPVFEIVEIYSRFAIQDTPEGLFASIEELNAKAPEGKSIDVDKMKTDIKQAAAKLSKDENVIKEWQEWAKKNQKDSKDTKAFQAYLEKGVTTTMKAKLMPGILKNLEDSKDLAYDELYFGIEPNAFENLIKDERMAPLAKLSKKFEDRLDRAMSALKNVE